MVSPKKPLPLSPYSPFVAFSPLTLVAQFSAEVFGRKVPYLLQIPINSHDFFSSQSPLFCPLIHMITIACYKKKTPYRRFFTLKVTPNFSNSARWYHVDIRSVRHHVRTWCLTTMSQNPMRCANHPNTRPKNV